MTVIFILGGARSGKSRRAQALCEALSLKRIYIATGQAFDVEMEDRIKRHQQDRDESWTTVEAPLDLVKAVETHAEPDNVVLIDCLTLWLSNLMHRERDIVLETANLIEALSLASGNIILVSNEVGLGLVPETPLGRAFRDEQGRLNQKIAAMADKVEFIAAGLPLSLKG
ncbi:bifunctional adenosylcobinamide kinase/adenosylcobinamide-phosphate guanylyltransferase [Hirschia litorea]|uniref:Bifunctional adenosylcobalamin biosynthesis protein n=1 Tax=Hirschia litorea TaxID=1199156 RepID=A0ABW2IHF8_9PROT